MLEMPRSVWDAMAAHALDCLPEEACGLLGGAGDLATSYLPGVNAARSSRVFRLDPRIWLAADELDGVLAVVHSHTHTEAYPSPTDVGEAANPMLGGLRWVIVSLRHAEPSIRSFRIDGGAVEEEGISLVGR